MAPLSGSCFPFSVSFALFVHSDLSPHPWMSVAVSSSTSSTQIYLPPGWHKQREIALSFPRDSFQTCQVDDWLDSEYYFIRGTNLPSSPRKRERIPYYK